MAKLRAALLATLLGSPLAAQQCFFADTNVVSISAGGGPTFTLDAGAAHAGKLYLVLGSLSGTSPGMRFGNVLLPLNFDPYMLFLDGNPNLLIARSLALLDANGRSTAKFSLPAGLLGPEVLGTLMHHAYLVFGPGLCCFDKASNALPLTLVR